MNLTVLSFIYILLALIFIIASVFFYFRFRYVARYSESDSDEENERRFNIFKWLFIISFLVSMTFTVLYFRNNAEHKKSVRIRVDLIESLSEDGYIKAVDAKGDTVQLKVFKPENK